MTRYLSVLLSLALLFLTGCNQGSNAPDAEAPAEAVVENPMSEPPSTVEEGLAEQAEEVADEVVSELPGTQIPDLVLCTEPRPEICTQDYTPVCGQHKDGSRTTYSNSCTACSNPDVVGSLPGACPD